MFIGDISKFFTDQFRPGGRVFNKFAEVHYMPGVLDITRPWKRSFGKELVVHALISSKTCSYHRVFGYFESQTFFQNFWF